MQRKAKQTRKRKQTRRWLALLITIALFAGMPSPGQAMAGGITARVDYGLSNPKTAGGVTVWDCVWFGSYWQNDTNNDGKADQNDAKQPIKWRVLSVNGDDAFLLADQGLDDEVYNRLPTSTNITWEKCTVRSWLNCYGAGSNQLGNSYVKTGFINNAFTEGERAAIRTTTVVNADNPQYGTPGGTNTSDKVYLLSLDEATNPTYGFTSDYNSTKTREARITDYTKEKNGPKGDFATHAWWLRSPGQNEWVSLVYYQGEVGIDGIVYAETAVRPVLHLDLSATSSYAYAGTVSSEGGQSELPPPTAIPTPNGNGVPNDGSASDGNGVPDGDSDSDSSADSCGLWCVQPENGRWHHDMGLRLVRKLLAE